MTRRHTPLLALSLLLLACAAPLAAQAPTPEAAKALYDAGDWAAAAKAYRTIVAANPENADAWFLLSQARHNLGAFEAALAAFEGARRAGLPQNRLNFHKARTLASMGRNDEAIGALQALIDNGARPLLALQSTTEFDALEDDPMYQALLDQLKPCNSPQYRQFDFWIGQWDVTNVQSPNTTPRPTNKITALHGGCLIHEEYQAGSFTGTSMNYYDAQADKWFQTWIDNRGSALRLSGGLEGGRMVMATSPRAKPAHRITWSPLDDGRVRQHWETSADGGKTWVTSFEGIYNRKK